MMVINRQSLEVSVMIYFAAKQADPESKSKKTKLERGTTGKRSMANTLFFGL